MRLLSGRSTSAPRTAAQQVRRALAAVAGGRFAALPFPLVFWDGSVLPAAAGPADAPAIHVEREALGQLLHEPNQLGLTRAFVTGQLRFDGELREALALRNRFGGASLSPRELAAVGALALHLAGVDALRPPRVPDCELRPRGHRHSLRRDRDAVRHHYDVSNAFYRRLLGPTLVYSCAYFEDPDDPLDAAQERKLERICRKLRLEPGERLLDIGCGWGSLVRHAAEHHGVRAVGITVSERQAELARERVRDAGLADRVEIRVADYREVADGPYDKIASVGMYEHVGRAQLGAYAGQIAALLRPGGLALNHGISSLASSPAGAKSLIQRYVFPDGELQPVADVVAALQRAGLETRDVESMREHYALTLWRWLDNLEAHREAIVAEVGIERLRVWQLYMTGSALAFEDGDITIYQVIVARDGAAHGLPLSRGDLAADARAVAPGDGRA
ncbi:SAM-dependent methyltransferase [Capillimicrobium parvum]|nr:cyclopropane-fatty-acyl-phospholipid synthase family protein [Capillimicrobium parvum]